METGWVKPFQEQQSPNGAAWWKSRGLQKKVENQQLIREAVCTAQLPSQNSQALSHRRLIVEPGYSWQTCQHCRLHS